MQVFGRFASNIPNTSRSAIFLLHSCCKVLSSWSNKENLFAEIIFQDEITNLPALPFRIIMLYKLQLGKECLVNLYQKHLGSIPLKNCEHGTY